MWPSDNTVMCYIVGSVAMKCVNKAAENMAYCIINKQMASDSSYIFALFLILP